MMNSQLLTYSAPSWAAHLKALPAFHVKVN